MDTASWTFSHSFTPQFQALRSDLESRIDVAKALDSPSQELIQELSVLLAKITKSLADATGSIPSYDQKQYEIQLKGLEEAVETLRASKVPKAKFAFKRKPQPPSQVSHLTPAISKESSISSLSPACPTTSSNLTLSQQTHAYLTMSSLPTRLQQSDLSLSDLNDCIVNLLPTASAGSSLKISALHARNLKTCVVLLPSIDGSALLENISGCIIVLGCHQFRMHSSTRVDVFLSVSSNPIIETCKQIRFSQYPSNFIIPNPTPLAPFSVQDFSHIRASSSPHFLMMSDEDRDTIVQWLATAKENPTYLADLSTILPS
ncbi:TBCC-domain-containing protein [Phlegmacium glaucopus]|nr:TBCC-domain-containing protein [Phlegmacium glaucopus]